MSAQTAPPSLTLDDLSSGPPTISVELAGQFLGVSRTYAYEMARKGLLPTIKLGTRRVRVPSAALLRMLSADQ